MLGRLVLAGPPAMHLRRIGIIAAVLITAMAVPANGSAAPGGWSGPTRVGSSADCRAVAATVDEAGGFHVVAQCGKAIRYAQLSPGGTWTSTDVAPPRGHEDLVPQLAVDGNRLYLAYLEVEEGGCGDETRVGMFYRWRTLPSGPWSAPIVMGRPTDTLQSFRVVNQAIWAVVRDTRGDGRLDLLRRVGGVERRWRLPATDPHTYGPASLRVGSDGHPRMAYEDGSTGLRFALFNGSTFTSSRIPGTGMFDHAPVLVLDAANAAHLTYVHEMTGCATSDTPADGTYYATNAGGSWTPASQRRITTSIAWATSLAVDTATRRVHLAAIGQFGTRYYTKTASGSWSRATLSAMTGTSIAIRLDQRTGRLLIALTALPSQSASAPHLYAFVKG